jgi:hypothetical protein
MSASRQSTNGHVKGVAAYSEDEPAVRPRRGPLSRLLVPALITVVAVVLIRALQRAGEL